MRDFLRFVILAFITTPPNYKWQQLLERHFPAYDKQTQVSLPLTRRDAKERDEDNEVETEPKRKLSIRNTLAKWFIDCMTIGALLNTVAWIVLVSLLKGQSRQQVISNVRTVSILTLCSLFNVETISQHPLMVSQFVKGYRLTDHRKHST